MSTPFYDLASLVLVPSGYKASKVYAQKPLTTDGQLTFSRASTATRVNSAGLIETVSSNVPRLDYLGSTCPKLQLEPSRTNVIRFSEQIDNAAWGKANCSISANALISPDGTQDADYIIEDSSASTQHRVNISVSGTTNTVHTLSVFIKQGSGTRNAYIDFGPTYCYYNFSTGAISAVGGTASVQNYGNGWFRLIITQTSASTPATVYIGLANGNNETYTGNGTSSIAFWGAQLEAGAYATSLIPTTTAAVTRLADFDTSVGSVGDFNLTPTGTKAVLFWEYQFNPGDATVNVGIGGFRNGTTNQYGMYYWGSDGSKQFGFNSWNGDSYGITGGNSLFDGQIHKIAGVFDFNNFANNVLFIDGVKKTISQVKGTTLQRGANKVSLNSPDAAGQGNKGMLRKFMYFNQNLTDAQLAELTAL